MNLTNFFGMLKIVERYPDTNDENSFLMAAS
jgi:hypothetical protein